MCLFIFCSIFIQKCFQWSKTKQKSANKSRCNYLLLLLLIFIIIICCCCFFFCFLCIVFYLCRFQSKLSLDAETTSCTPFGCHNSEYVCYFLTWHMAWGWFIHSFCTYGFFFFCFGSESCMANESAKMWTLIKSLKNVEQNPNGEEKKTAKSAKNNEKPGKPFL